MVPEEDKVQFPGRTCEVCSIACEVKPLSRCGGCQASLYCSKECQEADWTVHKHFCKDKRPVCPIETRYPPMVYIGPVITLCKLNSAKPGDIPITNRMALYNPSLKEIYDKSTGMVKEYKENVKKELKAGEGQGTEPQEQKNGTKA